MKITTTLVATAIALMLTVTGSLAGTLTKGTVKKIDTKVGKITIIHEELVDLDMPAMTMVFRVSDDGMLTQLAEGQEIEFVADRVNGKLTVVELK
ncbi:copper-binding protein [Falsihalocynthiibacter sp. CO-5D18]|uniref:copper-binding protein n=1 Tax=Falsihalocynthiibacter sp. CO-5D18 TaxID=3240872 RepID=UPI0035104CD4